MRKFSRSGVLHSTSCRFRRPIFYPDTILVGTRASELLEDRFTAEYLAVSKDHGAVLSEGSGVIVSYDYEAGRKAPIPEAVRALIVELEGERLSD